MSEPSQAAIEAADKLFERGFRDSAAFKEVRDTIQSAIDTAISEQAATIAELRRQLEERTREVIGEEFMVLDERLQRRCAEQAATIERLEKQLGDYEKTSNEQMLEVDSLARERDVLRAQLAGKEAP